MNPNYNFVKVFDACVFLKYELKQRINSNLRLIFVFYLDTASNIKDIDV